MIPISHIRSFPFSKCSNNLRNCSYFQKVIPRPSNKFFRSLIHFLSGSFTSRRKFSVPPCFAICQKPKKALSSQKETSKIRDVLCFLQNTILRLEKDYDDEKEEGREEKVGGVRARRKAGTADIPRIVTTLRSISQIYQSFLNEYVCASGALKENLSKPRTQARGIRIGQRFLSPELDRRIHIDKEGLLVRRGSENKYGQHFVISMQGVFFKLNPLWDFEMRAQDFPGNEFSIFALDMLISGKAAPPTELMKIQKPVKGKEYNYLLFASTACEGENFRTALEREPNLRIDPTNFSFMVVLAILSTPYDGKPDKLVYLDQATFSSFLSFILQRGKSPSDLPEVVVCFSILFFFPSDFLYLVGR